MIHQLDDSSLLEVLQRLPPKDVATLLTSNKRLYSFADNEYLWEAISVGRFGVRNCKWLVKADTYKQACAEMHKICRRYGSYGLQSLRIWDDVVEWLQKHAPDILGTLQAGVQEDELARTEERLQSRIPDSLRALYRIVNGQKPTKEMVQGEGNDWDSWFSFSGLFGGYCVYDTPINLWMNQLHQIKRKRVIGWSGEIESALEIGAFPSCIVLARLWKSLLVTCNGGDVLIQTGGMPMDGLPCIPAMLYQYGVGLNGPGESFSHFNRIVESLDSSHVKLCVHSEEMGYVAHRPSPLLQWFESYVGRLTSGEFSFGPFPENSIRQGISLFPNSSPLCAEAITEGICVRISTIFLSERASVDALRQMTSIGSSVVYSPEYPVTGWAYCVRLSLLDEETQTNMYAKGDILNYTPLRQVQLRERHWLIQTRPGEYEEVRGPGVIGQHPILEAGCEEFSYVSQCFSYFTGGSLEGDFQFVEGTLENPGRIVTAFCPKVELQIDAILHA